MAKKSAIEKSKNLNGFEKKSRIKVLRKETEVDLYDVYRFWNSAVHGQDMIKQRLTHFGLTTLRLVGAVQKIM